MLFIFIISCTPGNLNINEKKLTDDKINLDQKQAKLTKKKEYFDIKEDLETNEFNNENINFDSRVTFIFSQNTDKKIINQFINILELAINKKGLKDISVDIRLFENQKDISKILINEGDSGKIFIGPLDTTSTKLAKKHCNNKFIFFSFSPDTSIADECIFLVNFFPKNELEIILNSLDSQSQIALLYPENEYGYMINSIIDDIIAQTEVILVNRSSYKNDLSNVRDSIKELGKYELRKYELERQKKILQLKNDNLSKKRLKKLEKFKTTNDYNFTHVLIADYGLNLLQVAPLLPYYDIDPNIVQFIGTGVIDDKNFFYEPSLQGTIFPGIEISNRIDLLNDYQNTYGEKLLRISTLPYDVVGLLNFIFKRNISYNELIKLINDPNVKFDGVDGKFYFRNNIIQRDLDILKISNGQAKKIN